MKENSVTMFFAKLKGNKGEHKIVFNNKDDLEKLDFFNAPEIPSECAIKFDAEKNLEADEWFYIELDEKHKVMLEPYCKSISSSFDLRTITAEDYPRVETLYKVTRNEEGKFFIVFLKITKAYYIISKSSLMYRKYPDISTRENVIDLPIRQDAYFDGEKRIYFKKFFTIRSMFNNVDDYYREATKEEVKAIKASNMFDIDNGFKIKIRNLKHIAMIFDDDSISLNDISIQNKLKAYVEKYKGHEITIDSDGKFKIKNNAELAIVLKALRGHYYVSEITNEKMEATSASKLEGYAGDEDE
ncbi:MAG: hypothetical protein LBL41_00040 [Bifidobacteriaceae bacterium]|jgi:hypothetical protein|nr:hypothetical protein [Bifidobacteriaceae bacterium]